MASEYRTLAHFIPQPQSASRRLLRDALLVFGGSLTVALLAQVAIPLNPVPVTGQTLGVLLVGMALGWRQGGLALLTYLIEGLIGLPVFANHTAGLAIVLGPTGGYLVGFIAAAMLVGYLAEHGWDRMPITTALAMVLGNAVIYLFGLAWLAHTFFALPFNTILSFGLYPFLVGDLIKLAIAATILPAARYVVTRPPAWQ